MSDIVLNNGMVAVVDDDMAHLCSFRWTAHTQNNGIVYATRSERVSLGVWRTVLLHRQVMGCVYGDPPVDHIDGNGLNCMRENLRISDTRRNAMNRSGANATNKTTSVLGVSYRKDRNKYRASIKVNGRTIHLGLFERLEDARQARICAELEHWGRQPRRLWEVSDAAQE